MWCTSVSMSDPRRSSSFRDRWLWLAPEPGSAPPGAPVRHWPESTAAALAARLDLLQDALRSLPEGLPPSSLRAGQSALARRLLQREVRDLQGPPHRLALAESVARRLEELLPTDPAACREALRQLPQWSDALPKGAVPGGDREQALLAAKRLRALASFLEGRLRRSLGEMAADSTQPLHGWIQELEALPDAVHEPGDAHWQELREGGWDMAPLLVRLEEEQARVRREADKRAEQVRQRFLGTQVGQGDALPWVLEQLALDPAPPEQWLWLHHSLQRQALRLLGQLGLACEELPFILRPAYVPGCADPSPSRDGALCGLGDLSSLKPAALSRHLAWASHVLPPLSVAREGLPGRAWLLRKCRGEAQEDLSAVIAALVRVEDGEVWARWASEWMLRQGWQAGDLRVRLAQKLQEAWDLLLARADVELHLGIRSPLEVKHRLLKEGLVPTHVAEAAWQLLNLDPGRFALASARLILWREAERRWRRTHREAGTADWFHVLAEGALFPLSWQRVSLASQPAPGLSWRALPPALVKPISPRGDGLLTEVEERLAALGRIRREDIEAGREFDTQPAPSTPVAEQDEVESGGTDEAAA